jgi:hypothetical protein
MKIPYYLVQPAGAWSEKNKIAVLTVKDYSNPDNRQKIKVLSGQELPNCQNLQLFGQKVSKKRPKNWKNENRRFYR